MEEPVHNAAWADTKAKMKHCITDSEKVRIHHVDALVEREREGGGSPPDARWQRRGGGRRRQRRQRLPNEVVHQEDRHIMNKAMGKMFNPSLWIRAR